MAEEVAYYIRNRDRLMVRQAKGFLTYFHLSPWVVSVMSFVLCFFGQASLGHAVAISSVTFLMYFSVWLALWGYVLLILTLYLLGIFNFWLLLGLIAFGYYLHRIVRNCFSVLEQSQNQQS